MSRKGIEINGETPKTAKPRKLYVKVDSQGCILLTIEHAHSENGWAVRITDEDELEKLRNAILEEG